MLDVSSKNDLNIIRTYFSHNIRTSTAIIVATVSIIEYGLADDIVVLSESISETAYLLDIYDKGMEICFDYCLNGTTENLSEEVEVSKIINHLISKLPQTLKEYSANVEIDIDDFVATSNFFAVKTLLEIIICEMIKKTAGNILIESKQGKLHIYFENELAKMPEVFEIFKLFFKSLSVEFNYYEKIISMRFISEDTNS